MICLLKLNIKMKGIIFAGCSFTWGQGLYYYSDYYSELKTLMNPNNWKSLKDAYKKYMYAHRYPRLVANHFNTFEVVRHMNGGDENISINFINFIFSQDYNKERQFSFSSEKYSYNDIEYIIIQTSQANRCIYDYEYKGQKLQYSLHDSNSYTNFYNWLNENNISFEDWSREHISNIFNKVKNTMMFYEDKNIKTKILSWTPEYLDLILNDEWVKSRFIKLNYNNKEYETILSLNNENSMSISGDYEYFENPPVDHHPSMKAHQVIANSIISSIELDLK